MTRATTPDLLPIAESKDMLLSTRKRDGTWVPTPVNPVVEGDHVYFRTWATSGKAKRLRNFPEVAIRPCTRRGRPTGSPLQARATLLDGSAAAHAAELLDHRFPVLQRFLVRGFHRLLRYDTQHYVVAGIRAE